MYCQKIGNAEVDKEKDVDFLSSIEVIFGFLVFRNQIDVYLFLFWLLFYSHSNSYAYKMFVVIIRYW